MVQITIGYFFAKFILFFTRLAVTLYPNSKLISYDQENPFVRLW